MSKHPWRLRSSSNYRTAAHSERTKRIADIKRVTWLPSPRSEAQASRWCCTGITFFANSCNSFVTWGLSVTVCHSTCIFCVHRMTLYWPTLHFYTCVYVSFVCRYVAPPGVCYYNTITLRLFFITECVIVRCLCAMRVFEVRDHPHPLSYLCAKFRFFRGLHCWVDQWRKNRVLDQSLTQLIWCPGNWSLRPGTYCDRKIGYALNSSFWTSCTLLVTY